MTCHAAAAIELVLVFLAENEDEIIRGLMERRRRPRIAQLVLTKHTSNGDTRVSSNYR